MMAIAITVNDYVISLNNNEITIKSKYPHVDELSLTYDQLYWMIMDYKKEGNKSL